MNGPSDGKAKEKAKAKDDKEETRTVEGDKMVQEVMEELMANLGKGMVDTNIFAPAVRSGPSTSDCVY